MTAKFIVRIAGEPVEYDSHASLQKAVDRVPIQPYLELKQHGISLDDLDNRRLSWRELLVCWVYLLRRGAGEQVAFADVAAELVPEDVVIDGPDDAPAEDEPPDPPAAGDDEK